MTTPQKKQKLLKLKFVFLMLAIASGSSSILEASSSDNPDEKEHKNVKLLIEILRHGHRTPVLPITRNKSNWATQYGPGILTSTGERQVLLLGQQIAKEYSLLLSSAQNHESHIRVRSSGIDRSFRSALCHLQGMFKRKGILEFNEHDSRLFPKFGIDEDLKEVNPSQSVPGDFELINIRADAPEDDFLMTTHARCRPSNEKYQEVFDAIIQNKKQKDEIKFLKYKQDILSLARENNLDTSSLETGFKNNDQMILPCYQIADYFLSEKIGNPNTKINFDDPRFKLVSKCIMIFYLAFTVSSEHMETVGSPLMMEILNRLEHKVEYLKSQFSSSSGGKSEVEVPEIENMPILNMPDRFILFGGHEINIMNSLHILGLLNRDCILKEFNEDITIPGCISSLPYASNLLFELEFDPKTRESFVNVKFNGKYLNVCKENQDSKKYSCKIGKFVELVNKKLVFDWYERCGHGEPEEFFDYTGFKLLLVLMFGVNIFLVLFVICVVMRSWKTSKLKEKENPFRKNGELRMNLGI